MTTITDTDTNDTYTVATGLHVWAVNNSVRCDDCNAWAYPGENIRHSSLCDTNQLQAKWQSGKIPQTTTVIAEVDVPTVSDGGAIDWSKICEGTKEYEAAMYFYGQGGGNYDMI